MQPSHWSQWGKNSIALQFWAIFDTEHKRTVILRLHYVPGGHGGHVSDNREQNGITVRQRRGTG